MISAPDTESRLQVASSARISCGETRTALAKGLADIVDFNQIKIFKPQGISENLTVSFLQGNSIYSVKVRFWGNSRENCPATPTFSAPMAQKK